MANKTIPELTSASVLNDADYLVVSQGGVTKKIVGSVAKNADTVDSIHAAAAAAPNVLLALNSSSKLPASITGDADTVDSRHASATPAANTIPVTAAGGNLDNGWLNAATSPTADFIPIADSNGVLARAWTPQICFSATKTGTTSQVMPHGEDNKVVFPTALFDIGAYYDDVNSKWVPPSGKYRVKAQIEFYEPSGAGQAWVSIRKNNATVKSSMITQASGSRHAVSVSCIVDVDGDDYLEVFSYNTFSADQTIPYENGTVFFEGNNI